MRQTFIALLVLWFGVIVWQNSIGFFGDLSMTVTHFHRWRDRFNHALMVGGWIIIAFGVPVITMKLISES